MSPSYPQPSSPLQPDAKELLLCQNPAYACETYIFEPAPEEAALGYMYAAAETEDRGGVGKELLDLVISAIQKEYYRDPKRSSATSFELALHQANLILHDSIEQGIRDWMGYFHVSIAVLAGSKLHISVSGGGSVQLVRKGQVSDVATGLAHYPITNPLRTFSQLASGEVMARDTIFLSTVNFTTLYRPEDLAHFAIDHSAATITARLQQLYTDQSYTAPVAAVTISLLPKYIVRPREEASLTPRRDRAHANTQQQNLAPRKPLVIHRTALASFLYMAVQVLGNAGQNFKTWIWPHIKKGSQRGGQAIYNASQATGRNVKAAASKQLARLSAPNLSPKAPLSILRRLPSKISMPKVKTWPAAVTSRLHRLVTALPGTSKLFAVVALLLLIALSTSLVLLHKKRISDTEIQQASQLLHQAITKRDAAQSALVYNNRDQAVTLLNGADDLLKQLQPSHLYEAEAAAVAASIATERDRMEKITRAKASDIHTVGDFSSLITQKDPTALFFVNDALYTYNPENNAIVKMEVGGQTAVVSENTAGINFFTTGLSLPADKTILLGTSEASMAIFDSKANTIAKQPLEGANNPKDTAVFAAFGSRLYVYDVTAKNIFSYSKTLRGYTGGTAWITDAAFPKDSITSLAVDGSIYTLHSDGTIRRLFKGANTDYKTDSVTPPLAGATRLLTSDLMRNIYIFDPAEKRIVIFNKKSGVLTRQIFFDKNDALQDIAIDDQENTIYVLTNKKVLSVPVAEEATEQKQ